MRLTIHAAICLTAMSLLGGLAMADSSGEIIAARKSGYKHIGEIDKAMKGAVDGGDDVAGFAAPASEIAAWGRKLVTLFPPGTETGGETKARPEIWTRRPEFETRASALVTEAEKLSAVAATGDKEGFAAQWRTMGDACYACHKQFKYKG